MPDLVIDTRELINLKLKLGSISKEIPGAISSSINRSLSTANTQMKREVASHYNLKQNELFGGKKFKSEKSNDLIKVIKASTTKLEGRVHVEGHTLNLSRFLIRPKSPEAYKGKKINKRPGVIVRVTKERKPVTIEPKAFVARGKGGNTGIFTRSKTKGLIMLRTLSVPQMVGNKDVMEKIQEVTQKKFNERVVHEIEFRLDRARRMN